MKTQIVACAMTVFILGCGTRKDPGLQNASVSRVAPCATASHPRITGQGVGPVQVGLALEEVKRVCNVVGDSIQLGSEGAPERTASLQFGVDTVALTVDSGRVARMTVMSPGLSTDDTLRVGSTMGQLRRAEGVEGVEGEGALFVVLRRHCGMSFRLTYEVPTADHRERWSATDLRRSRHHSS